MASRGESKSMKRFAAPDVMKIGKKAHKFVKKQKGPHAKSKSASLLVVVRDMLGLANTYREAKRVLSEGKIFVDGKVAKDPKRAIGFMDVVTIPSIDQYYRVVYDNMGRIALKETDRKASDFKLCKVMNKTIVKKGKTQLNLHDGKNILTDKKLVTGSAVKISLPDLKIIDSFPLDKGNMAYVTGGKHAGETAVIEEVIPGTIVRESMVELKSKDKEFKTRKDYVFVIGTKEPAINIER